jgi:hypothetical protein
MLRFQVAYDIYLQLHVCRVLQSADNALKCETLRSVPANCGSGITVSAASRVAVEKYACRVAQTGSQNLIAIEPTDHFMLSTTCNFCMTQKNRLNLLELAVLIHSVKFRSWRQWVWRLPSSEM